MSINTGTTPVLDGSLAVGNKPPTLTSGSGLGSGYVGSTVRVLTFGGSLNVTYLIIFNTTTNQRPMSATNPIAGSARSGTATVTTLVNAGPLGTR